MCKFYSSWERWGMASPTSVSWGGVHQEAGLAKASCSFPLGGVTTLGSQGKGGCDSWQWVGDWPLPSITTTVPSHLVSHLGFRVCSSCLPSLSLSCQRGTMVESEPLPRRQADWCTLLTMHTGLAWPPLPPPAIVKGSSAVEEKGRYCSPGLNLLKIVAYSEQMPHLLLLFSQKIVSHSSWPHGLQHALNRWCSPTISSSVALFSFCLQSFNCPITGH